METFIFWLCEQPSWSIPLILIGGILLFVCILTGIADLIEHYQFKNFEK